MRKSLMFIGIPVIVAGAALAIVVGARSGANSSDTFNNDLQQAQAAGLDLAQSQASKKYAATEIAPTSKPQQSKTLKLGAGPRVIRSKAPTVKAAPEPAPAAAVVPVPEPTPVAPEPAPQPVPEPVVVPQPEPAPGPILAGGTGRGTGRTGGGTGGTVGTGTSILGSILGAILRGGVVGGDGDTCDPRSTRGGGRRHPMQPNYPPIGLGTGRIFPGSR